MAVGHFVITVRRVADTGRDPDKFESVYLPLKQGKMYVSIVVSGRFLTVENSALTTNQECSPPLHSYTCVITRQVLSNQPWLSAVPCSSPYFWWQILEGP